MKFDCVFSVVYPSMDLITNYDSMCPGCITMCMEEGSEFGHLFSDKYFAMDLIIRL